MTDREQLTAAALRSARDSDIEDAEILGDLDDALAILREIAREQSLELEHVPNLDAGDGRRFADVFAFSLDAPEGEHAWRLRVFPHTFLLFLQSNAEWLTTRGPLALIDETEAEAASLDLIASTRERLAHRYPNATFSPYTAADWPATAFRHRAGAVATFDELPAALWEQLTAEADDVAATIADRYEHSTD